MLETMTPPNKWWALLLALTMGFWAEGAAAQSESEGDWFDEPATSERPRLEIHGEGAYDPPPADFQSAPPSGARDRSGDVVAESEEVAEEAFEDAESQERAVREFSPHLAPYGRWVDDPYYGRVWVPARGVVGSEFRPYVSGGHWELTADDDWLWVSDYPFGWVTFHYGRWAWLSGGAWGWVPGYAWAPAWVSFRVGTGGYVGWGPLPPYSVWRGGVFVSLGAYRTVPYVFVPTRYAFARTMPRYIVRDRHRVHGIAAGTHRYTPRYVAGGPRVRSPSPREARIASRYLPSRRVVAQPRSGYAATDYRRRVIDKRPAAYGSERRRAEPRRDSRPRAEPRYSSPPRYSAPPRTRSEPRYDSRPRQRVEPRYRNGPSPERARPAEPRPRYRNDDARQGGPRGAVQRRSPPERARAWRSQPGQQRSSAGRERTARGGYERRAATAPPARSYSPPARSYRPRSDAPRQRAPAAAERRAAPAERRGDARRGGGRAAPPQRSSRDRDDRGRSR